MGPDISERSREGRLAAKRRKSRKSLTGLFEHRFTEVFIRLRSGPDAKLFTEANKENEGVPEMYKTHERELLLEN
jgi:hypothetical protein